ncbi:MAG TPA: aminotransferase class IV [Flavisolibacter sp.]|nr:aminotransferase class IV [Flavisolibacter sp.]
MTDKWVFLNGKFIPETEAGLHHRDLSIQRGYGVFDFFKYINGVPVFLKEHLDRFFNSALEMHLYIPYTKEEIRDYVSMLIEKNGKGSGGLRLTLTGGYSNDGFSIANPNLLMACDLLRSSPPAWQKDGLRLMSVTYQRQLPWIKTTDYLMAIWLQPELKAKGADDLLYCQPEGIRECPRSNIFLITADDIVLTPSQHILKGITRQKVLELARKEGLRVEERAITMAELIKAKEVFVTSTTKNILPVSAIDQYSYLVAGAVTTKLSQLLSAHQNAQIAMAAE